MLSLRDNKVQLWKLFVHLIPFVVYLILFGLLVFGVLENTLIMQKRIGKHIFILGPISFVTYAIWSVFAGKKIFKEKMRQKLAMFVFARILLLFISLIFIIVFFSKKVAEDQQAVYLLRMVIYVCMLLAVFMIFSYVVDKLIKPNTVIVKKTKIPNHHLTQVFSMQIKQTFYQYINGFRIMHACELLQSGNKMLNLEELAEKCGFNSKVSFNRQFKQIMGCTPSAYRNLLSI